MKTRETVHLYDNLHIHDTMETLRLINRTKTTSKLLLENKWDKWTTAELTFGDTKYSTSIAHRFKNPLLRTSEHYFKSIHFDF